MNATTQSPLAQLARSEQQLASAIVAAADEIDRNAAQSLPAALAKLEAACSAARQRVFEAKEAAVTLITGVLSAMDAVAGEVCDGLDLTGWPEPPRPAVLPAPAVGDRLATLARAARQAPANGRKGRK